MTFVALSSGGFGDMSDSTSPAEDKNQLLAQFIEQLRSLQQSVDDNLLYAKCGYVKAQLFQSPIFSADRFAKFKDYVMKKATVIFNETVDKHVNDAKRRQIPISNSLISQFCELRKLYDMMQTAFGELHPKLRYEGAVLLSLAGCAAQEAHCDYPFDLDDPLHFVVKERDEVKRNQLRTDMYNNSRSSFVFFFALEAATTITILGPDGEFIKVHLEVGEALIASGFVVHCGDGSMYLNFFSYYYV